MKKAFNWIFLFIFFARINHTAHAFDFTTSYKVDYKINKDLEATIKQNLTIRNLSNNIFPTEYNFKINTIKIFDVEAYEGSDKLKTDVSDENGSTKINVNFKNEVIGEGKDYDWDLIYKTKDIASRNGSITDIIIPKFSVPDNISSYEVRLIVPKEFGQVTYISPKPATSSEDKENIVYQFSLDQIKNSPISASFGSFQTFNYKLSYSLQNNSFFSTEKSIAIPPDIQGKQQIQQTSFSVEPTRVQIDDDGNYIAFFKVPAKTSLTVEILGRAKVTNKPIDISKGGKVSEIPTAILLEYTKSQKYWETNNSSIKAQADKLKDQSGLVIPQTKKVYEFVIETLKYKNEKNLNNTVSRLGAKKALENPNEAICMEYVDLFIALARSLGIPAREVNGYAYSNSNPFKPISVNLKGGDVLHAWAEFYDPKLGWIQVDPTWGSTSKQDYFTKLDTNHLAFVIKGISSEYPLPAGAYKDASKENRQVDVAFTENETKPVEQTVEIKAYKSNGFSPTNMFSKKVSALVFNNGSTAIFNVESTQRAVPPKGIIKVDLTESNGKVQVMFEDFSGNKTVKEVTLDKLPQSLRPVTTTYYLFFPALLLAPVLCMILYFLVIRKRNPQK